MRDTRLDKVILAVDQAAGAFAMLNDLAERAVFPYQRAADAYIRTMAPLAHSLIKWQASMAAIFPPAASQKQIAQISQEDNGER
jgi:hypothetical protein